MCQRHEGNGKNIHTHITFKGSSYKLIHVLGNQSIVLNGACFQLGMHAMGSMIVLTLLTLAVSSIPHETSDHLAILDHTSAPHVIQFATGINPGS